ncbi:MAG: uL30 family ribosomal protein [Saprospiraceae bacterium]
MGLARPHSVVIKEVNPAIMGMVKKVSHLISVEKI